ncbi:MAG: 50S ribosomal protein L32 [Candidatus Portnoybacteria bacterium CG10_big_fil_rev_8_21_14_0_10_36_7]|uniref:Large ribosomal subunit protein bL32 n=1 Tax=Candidatus Portnoybacteria bacterium CG10_big_fil_rev_8_21_14_0_10_36_7 TaxID=1974812 RepID=A0A2M8KEV4_9BACT|nr:MAG: 50S ribosomal protein L32 [Candidatus Portnoybacteria bacterium CG10_big_fil_rev_8_21_14_0_10_36_7]
MPVPKQRHTKSRRNKRRSHHSLKAVKLAVCSKCKEPVLPHQVCVNCGSYKGREVMKVESKIAKKGKKEQHKHDHDHDHNYEHHE